MNGRVLAVLVAAGFLLTAAAGMLALNLERFQGSFAAVDHATRVLQQIAAAEAALLQAESGERGYVLTGEASYRQNYERAKQDVTAALRALSLAVANDPGQAARLGELRALRDARLAEFETVVGLGPGRRDEAVAVLATARATDLTPLITDKLEVMRRAEQARLVERQQGVDRVVRQMTLGAIALAVLAVLSTAFGAYLLERNHAIAELQVANQRTQDLQSELLHVSRMSSMGEMASALAHEINQPLMAVANYLQGARRLLERSAGDKQAALVKGALEKATAQALRAGDVIRRLREFLARDGSEKRPESLGRLVEEASGLALMAARDHPVYLAVDIDPAADRVLVDRVQIQQVLLNLMRNGIEAMRDSTRRQLGVRAAPVGDGMVGVSVSDTGCGLSPEVAEKLFQPFVTSKQDGLGVGLSIARTIVEAHGGKIAATANEGGGTVFRFTLREAT